jgi:sugar phosphate isomerase/epimerase
MKLGIVSAIFDQSNFEEMINIVAENGLDCVEVACWPVEKATRRYAGVSHIDVTKLNEQTAQKITDYAASKNVEISALAYYPNPLDEDLQKTSSSDRSFVSIDRCSRLDGDPFGNYFYWQNANKILIREFD